MKRVLTLIGALMVVASPMAAQSPTNVKAVVQKMKDAFEPTRPSTRTLVITVSDLGDTKKFIAGQARKQLPDGKRMTTVLLQPADVRGMAFLVSEPKDAKKPTMMWIYVPFIRRVRQVLGIDAYEHFLGTDFSYADLGFVRQDLSYQLLGSEQHAGVKADKINEKFPPNQYYYSHLVMWVAQSNMLPLQRNYYDPAGALWKTELFDSVSVIDGSPTVLHVQMKDVQANTSTDLNVSKVQYDVALPDSLFDPTYLPKLADDPVWQSGGANQ